jgi:uncharacterized peroxidase-related enzyme
MRSHAHDLRAEVAAELGEAGADAWVDGFARDWQRVALDDADRALCCFADALTGAPAEMGQGDVDALRAAGLSDGAIHDAVQVVSYFNYINRVADALGVELETFVRAWGADEPTDRPAD